MGKSSRPRRAGGTRPEPPPSSRVAAPATDGLARRFAVLLAVPVSGASLAVFRIAFGLIMALEAWALCRPNPSAISTGQSPLATYYTDPAINFHFPYPGFEWLPLLPATGIHIVVALLGAGGLLMALGLWYRAAAALVFLSWGYLWLVESTRSYWQSHYYLEFLVAFLLVWMPAARRYSVDAWRARGGTATRDIPFWPVLLLRGQLVIAYFYAGVAKLNADWLLDAVPVRWFLARPDVLQPYARLVSPARFAMLDGIVNSVGLAYFLSYAGLVFDLAVGFLLLCRRTRLLGFVLMVIFHALNHLLIFDDIGWFPLLGVATALIFLEPDWPERFWTWLQRPRIPRPDWRWLAAGAVFLPVVGAALGWKARPTAPEGPPRPAPRLGRWTVVGVALWLAWQAAMPLRHFLIPGDARFTYEGLSFSWRLKSETHHAYQHRLYLQDDRIVSSAGSGRAQLHWDAWPGDRAVYRRLQPGGVLWAALPRILITVEPHLGERVIYNPAPAGARTEAAARADLAVMWRELYGREPRRVEAARGLPAVLESLAAARRGSGPPEEADKFAELAARVARLERGELPPDESARTAQEAGGLLEAAAQRPELLRELRRLAPFLLEGEGHRDLPFLIIEDDALLVSAAGEPVRVNPAHWRTGPATRDPGRTTLDAGGDPRLIYLGEPGPAGRVLLPRACLLESQTDARRPPRIWWNSARDLTSSKLIHTSGQAFYLRRYARRVADLWAKETGRRPAIYAVTSMSLNGRPHQELVDPRADLAAVPVRAFGRNAWIRDLQTRRIPREALEGAKGSVGN